MVSLGTGVAPPGVLFDADASWLGSARDLAGLATSVWAGEVLARRAVHGGSFHRLQIQDARVAGAMDDPSEARLDQLRKAAQALIVNQSDALDAAVVGLRSA
jgi:hypothetical protein